MKFKIVEDSYLSEPRINLSSPLTKEVIDFINSNNVKSILLNQRLGWKSQPLDLLLEINDLKCLYVMDDDIQDLSVIENFADLECLLIECSKVKKGLDFGKLKNLSKLSLDWLTCFDSLHNIDWLTSLRIDKYKGKDLSKFQPFPNLTRFDLVISNIQSLNGIEQFTSLKELMLFRCSKLQDISHLTDLSITKLDIETCKNIENLEVVFGIKSIESLCLEKCSSILSISGVSELNLRKLRISDTTIEDGNLTEIVHLDDCDVFFNNKKHYSHKYVWVDDYSRKVIIPAN